MLPRALPEALPSRRFHTFGRVFRGFLLASLLLPACESKQRAATSGAPAIVTTPGGIEMVALPGGWFEMGSPQNEDGDDPRHRIFVSPFAMDRTEVTQAEYEKLMKKNPSLRKGEKNPVEQIRWADAAEFCNARSRADGLEPAYTPKTWECRFEASGYRLPTEAEWEYACRAGTEGERYFGSAESELGRYAWFKGSCWQGPNVVGAKLPNPWGFSDLYGNVWEWCNDYYDEKYYLQGPARDPRGPNSGKTRVVRGGCWASRANECGSAYRGNEEPAYTDVCFAANVNGMVGFRCVKRLAAQ